MHTVPQYFLLQRTDENIYSQAGVWIQRAHLWKPAVVVDSVSFSHSQHWSLDVDKQRKSIIMGFKTSKTLSALQSTSAANYWLCASIYFSTEIVSFNNLRVLENQYPHRLEHVLHEGEDTATA